MISSMFFPSNAANSESILSASGSQEPALRTSTQTFYSKKFAWSKVFSKIESNCPPTAELGCMVSYPVWDQRVPLLPVNRVSDVASTSQTGQVRNQQLSLAQVVGMCPVPLPSEQYLGLHTHREKSLHIQGQNHLLLRTLEAVKQDHPRAGN